MGMLIKFITEYVIEHDEEFQKWKKEQEPKHEKDCS